MDLALTPAQELLKSSARSFLDNELGFLRRKEIDRTEGGFDEQIWRETADLGWCGVLVPEEYGGLGSSYMDAGVLFMEMGHALVPGPQLETLVIAPEILKLAGTPEQQSKWLSAIAEGTIRFTLAFTEAEASWDPDRIALTATRDGDDYLLNGVKWFVPDAAISDLVLCVARTRAPRGRGDGLTLFAVETASVTTQAVSGWYPGQVANLNFDRLRVPASAVIGTEHEAWTFLEPAFARSTLLLCAYMTGACEYVYNLTLEYVRNRVQFGQPIGRFQRVQDHVINLLTALDGARWTTYEGLSAADTGAPIALEASVAKAAASDGYSRACLYSQEAHGAIGTSREYPLHLHHKTSRWLFSYLGDPAYHYKQIGRLLEF